MQGANVYGMDAKSVDVYGMDAKGGRYVYIDGHFTLDQVDGGYAHFYHFTSRTLRSHEIS